MPTGIVKAQDASADLLGRINGLRSSLGLSPYRSNGALTAAALNHAQWMAGSGQASHTQPDGSRPRDRAQAAGYPSSWVSENIYMGYGGSVEGAWSFWTNSPIHYAGLTSPNYQDIGIGVSVVGQNHAFVLVFGNDSGGSGVNVSVGANRSANPNASAPVQGAVAGLPPFVVGVDGVGNIMHEVQAGDTLGDIALIYGYDWDDIPTMLALNEMTWDDIRELPIGSIFLVPPYDGTYTPTPEPMTATPEATATPTAEPATATPEPTATAFTQGVSADGIALPPPVTFVAPSPTQGLVVRPIGTEVASVSQNPPPDTPPSPAPNDTGNRPPLWLWVAIVVQVGILLVAVVALIRQRET